MGLSKSASDGIEDVFSILLFFDSKDDLLFLVDQLSFMYKQENFYIMRNFYLLQLQAVRRELYDKYGVSYTDR